MVAGGNFSRPGPVGFGHLKMEYMQSYRDLSDKHFLSACFPDLTGKQFYKTYDIFSIFRYFSIFSVYTQKNGISNINIFEFFIFIDYIDVPQQPKSDLLTLAACRHTVTSYCVPIIY